MAVPTTGTITMLGLAQEVKFGTYGSGGLMPHAIKMSDLINGGGQNFFPAINTGCTPNPVDRSHYQITLTLAETFNSQKITVFTTRNPITGLVTNDILYDYVNGSYTAWTGASQTYTYWIFDQGTFFGCHSSACPNISVSSSGVVTTNGCQCP